MIVYKVQGEALMENREQDIAMARELGVEIVIAETDRNQHYAKVLFEVETYCTDLAKLIHWWTEGQYTDLAQFEKFTDYEVEQITVPDVKVRRQRLDELPYREDLELNGFDLTGRIAVSESASHTDLYEVRPAANPADLLWIAPDSYLEGWHEDATSRFWWRLHWNRVPA